MCRFRFDVDGVVVVSVVGEDGGVTVDDPHPVRVRSSAAMHSGAWIFTTIPV